MNSVRGRSQRLRQNSNCFAGIFKCLSTKKSRPQDQQGDPTIPVRSRSLNIRDQAEVQDSIASENENYVQASNRYRRGGNDESEAAEQQRILDEIRRQNQLKLKDKNKVRIKTNYQKCDVMCIEELPLGHSEQEVNQRQVYKYYCPICLRYFNHILISDCCSNYICRFCIGW